MGGEGRYLCVAAMTTQPAVEMRTVIIMSVSSFGFEYVYVCAYNFCFLPSLISLPCNIRYIDIVL